MSQKEELAKKEDKAWKNYKKYEQIVINAVNKRDAYYTQYLKIHIKIRNL